MSPQHGDVVGMRGSTSPVLLAMLLPMVPLRDLAPAPRLQL